MQNRPIFIQCKIYGCNFPYSLFFTSGSLWNDLFLCRLVTPCFFNKKPALLLYLCLPTTMSYIYLMLGLNVEILCSKVNDAMTFFTEQPFFEIGIAWNFLCHFFLWATFLYKINLNYFNQKIQSRLKIAPDVFLLILKFLKFPECHKCCK